MLDARDIVVTEIVLDPAQACFTRPARACDLPVLFVVYNNAGWERTRRATLARAPEGWAARNPSMPLCELAPPPAAGRGRAGLRL